MAMVTGPEVADYGDIRPV